MQPLKSYTRCPVDANNAECSGRGICSNINTCVCDYGFGGNDCSKIVPTARPPPGPKGPTKAQPENGERNDENYTVLWRTWSGYQRHEWHGSQPTQTKPKALSADFVVDQGIPTQVSIGSGAEHETASSQHETKRVSQRRA